MLEERLVPDLVRVAFEDCAPPRRDPNDEPGPFFSVVVLLRALSLPAGDGVVDSLLPIRVRIGALLLL
eukprot:5034943-Heterocapsa_arctica.AAC.1